MESEPTLQELVDQWRKSEFPQPDPAKGRTTGEWAEVWGVSQATALRRLRRFVKAGMFEGDRDVRAIADGRMMHMNVFRRIVSGGDEEEA